MKLPVPGVGLLVALLLAPASRASPFCPAVGTPNCQDESCKCDSNASRSVMFNDPVSAADGSSLQRVKDIELQGSKATLSFLRLYDSRPEALGYLHVFQGVPKPFGASPPMGNDPNAVDSLVWTHNFYSAVFLSAGSNWALRDLNGYVQEFAQCTPSGGGCFAPPSNLYQGTRDKLWYANSDTAAPGDFSQASFTLFKEGGRRYVYQSWVADTSSQVRRCFLSRVESPEYLGTGANSPAAVLANVSYMAALPFPDCPWTPPPAPYPRSYAPYLDSIVNEDGASLRFVYKRLQRAGQPVECVLAAIHLSNRSTDGGVTDVDAVDYSYEQVTGVETPGRIASASWPETGRSEQYDYRPQADGNVHFKRSQAGLVLTDHAYDSNSGMVVKASAGGEVSVPTWQGNGTCDSSSMCCQSINPTSVMVTDANAGSGDGTTPAGTGNFQRTYTSVFAYTAFHGPRLYQVADSCSVSQTGLPCAAVSQGSERWEWSCGPTAPGAEVAYKDKRNNWTVYGRSYAASPRNSPELTSVSKGATDLTGTRALEVKQYGYAYGGPATASRAYEQLLGHEEVPSVLNPTQGAMAHTEYVYEPGYGAGTGSPPSPSTNRLRAVIKMGWTQVYDSSNGFTVQQRYIGTFYFTRQVCSGGGADGQGRTLEVHGPCFVNGYADTDCRTGTSYPVTQYDYWPPASNNNSNRLRKVSRYPALGSSGTCSGPSVDTYYDAYDARGNPTQVRDGNNVTATSTYQGDQLVSESVAGATTAYAYDNGKLSALEYPQGNHEVFCHRTVAPGSLCSGGTWSDQLQWKAKFDSSYPSPGANWSELVSYTYWPDKTLASETYQVNGPGGAQVRRIKKYAADAHRRPTWEQWGDGSGNVYTATRLFDGTGNQTGRGLPYDNGGNPAAWCGGPADIASGAPQSRQCAALGYNRANRLTSVVQHPTASDPSQDTQLSFSYDAQGNVSSVDTANYKYDDFGNVIGVLLPNVMIDSARGAGTVFYEYDATGRVLRMQTPTMQRVPARLEYAYDGLGRQLSATRYFGPSGRETLYQLGYDNEGTLDASCPQPANTMGRLRYASDSFGVTFFQYDAWGRVTGESRLRAGQQTCGPANSYASPHTTYSYTANGNLASIVYPYGRTVTYVYQGGAATDRVGEVDVALFQTGGGTSTVQALTNVRWEPYGGLRGYQLNPPAAGSGSVEYVLGDQGNLPPASPCSSRLPTGSDKTGRLRAVWVSSAPSGGVWTPGSGGGDLYKRIYTWQADQVRQTDTCLLGMGTPRTEQYTSPDGSGGYDGLLRLTDATRPPGNFTATGGAFGLRHYAYDGNGNRIAEADEDGAWTLTQNNIAGAGLDQLAYRVSSNTGSLLGYGYSYDADGRVTAKDWSTPSSGPWYTLGFSSGPGNGGSSSVYTSVSVNGASYSYYYDVLGRRRLKVYPAGTSDEYFSDLANQLLTDQGNVTLAPQTTPHVIDDYVWLDGLPVALVRGLYDNAFHRLSDSGTSCWRNSDSDQNANCGLYFPVTDHLGKPVLMLDSALRIAGAADYDPFGHVNRVALHRETPHPYGTYSAGAGAPLADIAQRPEPGMTVKERLRFYLVNTRVSSGGACGDYAYPVDGDTGTPLMGGFGGSMAAEVVSPWLQPSAGHLQVLFNNQNCSNWDLSTCACYQPGGATQEQGVVLAGYEYQRYQAGASWFWTPLRFPGQYYDAESDLFQNWNRFYDPSIGRYLQPEPMLHSPARLVATAKSGLGLPSYTYAGGNPMFYVDADGLFERPKDGTHLPSDEECAQAASVIQNCALKQCVLDLCKNGRVAVNKYTKLNCADGDRFDALTGKTRQIGAYSFPPWWEAGSEVAWCNRNKRSKCAADMLVHEFAHVCGWLHDSELPKDSSGKAISTSRAIHDSTVPGSKGGVNCD